MMYIKDKPERVYFLLSLLTKMKYNESHESNLYHQFYSGDSSICNIVMKDFIAEMKQTGAWYYCAVMTVIIIMCLFA